VEIWTDHKNLEYFTLAKQPTVGKCDGRSTSPASTTSFPPTGQVYGEAGTHYLGGPITGLVQETTPT